MSIFTSYGRISKKFKTRNQNRPGWTSEDQVFVGNIFFSYLGPFRLSKNHGPEGLWGGACGAYLAHGL